MTKLRLFGPARDAAQRANDEIEAETVADVLAAAAARYGEQFAAVLAVSSVWMNGEAVDRSMPVGPQDEVAILPPVSGGC